jgi:dUTP pyrophosphatase
MKILIRKLSITARLPTYAYDTDAGMDLFSVRCAVISIGQSKVLQTGISVAIPEGYLGLIRPRSGIAKNHQVTMCSSGVIDSGYRGEITVQLINLGHETFQVRCGDRIAQMLILPVLHIDWEEVDELPESDRDINGYGSTGK